MAQTEAQLRASKKYDQKFEKILVRVPMGEKEIVEQHAASKGESVNTFVRRAIALTIELDRQNSEE